MGASNYTYRSRRTVVLIEKRCRQCTRPFSVPDRRAATALFCSRACYTDHRRESPEEHARWMSPEQFWAQVDKTGDGCWLWKAARTTTGYGRFEENGREVLAHRRAYELTNGPLPPGVIVRHKECDTPLCCRPEHLRSGTQADNIRDKVEHARQAKGEAYKHSKLTEAQVLAIRQAHRPGIRGAGCRVLARKFGVSPDAIKRVLNGRTWKHVGE